MRPPRLGRYTIGARWYDVLSAERFVYRQGRAVGLAEARPLPGDRVLDLGCGTGLNLELLVAAVGPTGSVVGVDRSASMLTGARRRVERHGWRNVELVELDAADLAGAAGVDFVVATYSLSIVADWQQAYDAAIRMLRPGGRVLVVDLAMPTGGWRVLWPLARLACWTGGVDPYREPWHRVESLDGVGHRTLRGGHVHASWGTKR